MAIKEIISMNKICEKLSKIHITPIMYTDNTFAIKVGNSEE